MFRKALLILSGNAAASLLLLARNLIIARLIPVADYGVAATFAVAIAVVEMMSALGLQQQIVQDKDGNNPHFQAALQGFQVLRGVIAAVVLFWLAEPIAQFLKIPDVAWAYRWMALVPLFNALQHFDMFRLNRDMRFWPMILTGGVPALISLILIAPLYYMFGDYQVMLWAIILQYGLMMVVSHLVAERPYRLVLDRAIMGRSLKFGWPILVNGVLMFGIFNGDKLIVGRELGIEMLAIFAMGITLTLTPTLVMSKSAQNFFLPQLSAAGEVQTPRFAALSAVTVETSLLMGMGLVLGTALLGEIVVTLLLGAKYAALVPLMTWLAILQAARQFKIGPAIIGLAVSQNEISMLGNLVRVLSLPVAWYIAATSGNLYAIIAVGTLGELLGHVVVMLLLKYRTGLALRPMLMAHIGAMGFLCIAGFYAYMTATQGQTSALLVGMVLAGFGAGAWSMRNTRQMYLTRSPAT